MLVHIGSSHGVRLAGACRHIAVVGLLCRQTSHSLASKLLPGGFVCLKRKSELTVKGNSLHMHMTCIRP